MTGAGRFDVFVSYAHEDEPWARVLAENLHRLGLDVWLDQWQVSGGDLVASRLQDGLAKASAVVAVISRFWVDSGWCGEEFAAAVTAAVERRQRLIPVLLGEVALPPFLASRFRIDFRHVASPQQYENLVRQVERAVRGLSSRQPPEGGGPLVAPPTAYWPEGPIAGKLRIGADSVVFATVDREVSCAAQGVDRALEQKLWGLQRARARAAGGMILRRRPLVEEAAAPAEPARVLFAVGEALGKRFVHGEAASELARQESLAGARNVSLRIGLAVDDPRWADLPWETLTIPGTAGPLVLSEQVELYRTVRRDSEPVAVQVPGPLRILAVVASPESGGGELLDYERELGRILDAVDPARSGHGAYVRVLNWGSLAEIRTALEQERFHILHLSCHAAPGVLILENDQGHADNVDAQRFMRALPANRGVPLVVLAGCSTARDGALHEAQASRQRPPAGNEGDPDAGGTGPDSAADADAEGNNRAGLARALLERGVPAVLAMTEAVTDRYATELTADMYQTLARTEHPNPLTALSNARRTLEQRRRQLPEQDPRAGWPEWATPALFLAGPPLPLFDRTDGDEQVTVVPEAVLDEGMVVRKVGEFVGRRAELRRLLAALRAPQRAGVLVHGIGGVGKSTLTAELLHQYGTEHHLLVPVAAAVNRTVDAVLETLRQCLNAHCLDKDLPETGPLRRVAVALADASSPWRDRWELVRRIVLPRLPALMIVDNAEDLLAPAPSGEGWELADGDLSELLAAWTAASPRTRLLITSRYPFSLPRHAHR
ncbi:TIR domain-containing protein, partial [Streptomyces sp. NPDC001286]